MRRDARSPWRMEFLIDRVSTGTEWVFKRDESGVIFRLLRTRMSGSCGETGSAA